MAVADPLTKSLFVAGVQCVKQLSWRVHEPLAEELQPDIVLQDRFDQGRQVGELARATFPNGLLLESRVERDARLAETARAMDAQVPLLFESSFHAGGVFVSVDVLQRDDVGHTAARLSLHGTLLA